MATTVGGKIALRRGWNGKPQWVDGWWDFGGPYHHKTKARQKMRRCISKARRRNDRLVCKEEAKEE